MNKVLIFATFKKGFVLNIVDIVAKFKEVDNMAAIVDNGIMPGREFQFQMVASLDCLNDVMEAFGRKVEVGIVSNIEDIEWHFKWDRKFEVKAENTL
jgi:hypothetical protein